MLSHADRGCPPRNHDPAHTMSYVEPSGIAVSRDVVLGLYRWFLRFIAERNAQGVTLGQVRDEPLLLA